MDVTESGHTLRDPRPSFLGMPTVPSQLGWLVDEIKRPKRSGELVTEVDKPNRFEQSLACEVVECDLPDAGHLRRRVDQSTDIAGVLAEPAGKRHENTAI